MIGHNERKLNRTPHPLPFDKINDTLLKLFWCKIQNCRLHSNIFCRIHISHRQKYTGRSETEYRIRGMWIWQCSKFWNIRNTNGPDSVLVPFSRLLRSCNVQAVVPIMFAAKQVLCMQKFASFSFSCENMNKYNCRFNFQSQFHSCYV